LYFTYVLYSHQYDRIYVGQSSNIEVRLSLHNKGFVHSTKPYRPWKLIHFEEFSTRIESMKREKELKSHKGREFIREKYLKTKTSDS
jgi:putative endonuclease